MAVEVRECPEILHRQVGKNIRLCSMWEFILNFIFCVCVCVFGVGGGGVGEVKIIQQKLPLVHLCKVDLEYCCKCWSLHCHIKNSKTKPVTVKIYFNALSNILWKVWILYLLLLSLAMKEYVRTLLKVVQHASRLGMCCWDNTPHHSTQSVIACRKIITVCSITCKHLFSLAKWQVHGC
jgi:hypothetical protein